MLWGDMYEKMTPYSLVKEFNAPSGALNSLEIEGRKWGRTLGAVLMVITADFINRPKDTFEGNFQPWIKVIPFLSIWVIIYYSVDTTQ